MDGKLSSLPPADAINDAYRKGLAWQYHRVQKLGDLLERELDRMQAERIAQAQERGAWAAASLERGAGSALASVLRRSRSASSQAWASRTSWRPSSS